MKVSPDLPTITGPPELNGTDRRGNRLAISFVQTSVGPLASSIKLTFDPHSNQIVRSESDLVTGAVSAQLKDAIVFWSHLRRIFLI